MFWPTMNHKPAGHGVSTGLWCSISKISKDHILRLNPRLYAKHSYVSNQGSAMCYIDQIKSEIWIFTKGYIHLIPSLCLSFYPWTDPIECHIKLLRVSLSFSSQAFHVSKRQLLTYHNLLLLWGKSAIKDAFIEITWLFVLITIL